MKLWPSQVIAALGMFQLVALDEPKLQGRMLQVDQFTVSNNGLPLF